MTFKKKPCKPHRFGVDGRTLKVKRGAGKRVELSVLTAQARNKLPAKAFALPGDRYPIHDLAHAKAALSRVAQHGTPEEKKRVARAVAKRYGIGPYANDDRQGRTPSSFAKKKQGKPAAKEFSSDHSSSTHPDLLNKPGVTNWVEEQGGLPSFIERVAKHIQADGGLSESHSIAAAVKQCRDGRFGAKGLAAYAEFRAKAAAARAS